MLTKKAGQRPSAQELFKYPFFSQSEDDNDDELC